MLRAGLEHKGVWSTGCLGPWDSHKLWICPRFSWSHAEHAHLGHLNYLVLFLSQAPRNRQALFPCYVEQKPSRG